MTAKYKIILGGFLILVGIVTFLISSDNKQQEDEQGEEQKVEVNKPTTMLETVEAYTFAEKSTEDTRIIIDVRTPEEYAAGHIENSRNIDYYAGDFVESINTLDKSVPYAIYCRSGNRSGQALSMMAQLGFIDVVDLNGGIVAWEMTGETLCTEC